MKHGHLIINAHKCLAMKIQNEILNRVGTEWEDFQKGMNENHVVHYSQGMAQGSRAEWVQVAKYKVLGSRREGGSPILLSKASVPHKVGHRRDKSLPAAAASSPVPNLAQIFMRHMQGTFWATNWWGLQLDVNNEDNSTDWDVCFNLPPCPFVSSQSTFWQRGCFGVTWASSALNQNEPFLLWLRARAEVINCLKTKKTCVECWYRYQKNLV